MKENPPTLILLLQLATWATWPSLAHDPICHSPPPSPAIAACGLSNCASWQNGATCCHIVPTTFIVHAYTCSVPSPHIDRHKEGRKGERKGHSLSNLCPTGQPILPYETNFALAVHGGQSSQNGVQRISLVPEYVSFNPERKKRSPVGRAGACFLFYPTLLFLGRPVDCARALLVLSLSLSLSLTCCLSPTSSPLRVPHSRSTHAIHIHLSTDGGGRRRCWY